MIFEGSCLHEVRTPIGCARAGTLRDGGAIPPTTLMSGSTLKKGVCFLFALPSASRFGAEPARSGQEQFLE
jgi:hypothetical protein